MGRNEYEDNGEGVQLIDYLPVQHLKESHQRAMRRHQEQKAREKQSALENQFWLNHSRWLC